SDRSRIRDPVGRSRRSSSGSSAGTRNGSKRPGMMHKVSIRPEAEDDLEAIYGFIAERSPRAAIKLVRDIRRLCMSLAEFPNRGAGRDRRLAGVRIVVLRKRVTIAY